MITDIRYALRQLVKHPSFTIIAIFALALGIGANTAIFSVVNAVLLRPLPYPQPEELILLRERANNFEHGSVGYVNWLDWRAAQRTFTSLALVRRESFNFSVSAGSGAPERVRGLRASADFLSVLGLKPRIGRGLQPAEDQDGAHNVAIISETLWRNRFSGSASVLGSTVVIDGLEREIVGVYPSSLQFGRYPDVIVPLGEIVKMPGMQDRGNHQGFSALGRLKPGTTLEQAHADMDAIALNLEAKFPATNTGRRIEMQRLYEATVADYRAGLRTLMAAVACVLLIACANVANLQLARALARGKEMAVRAALGASRWRLARQLLAESTILALVGGAAGVLLTVWSLDAILALTPRDVPRFHETKIDFGALAFTGLIAIAAGVLVGLWPAWRISRTASLSLQLHEVGGRGSSGSAAKQHARSALVILQVALAILLLAGAGLTLKSFWAAQNEPLGFNPHGIVNIGISLPEAKYPTDEKKAAFWKELLDRVQTLPGVESAATSANSPFDDTEWDSYFHITGTPPTPPGQEPSAEVSPVSADYFKVMGMPILRGRAFGPEDLPGEKGHSRSIIIDESFARKYFAGKDPIGLHIDDNQTSDKTQPPMTIVGIVPRTRNEAPGEDNSEKLRMVQEYLYSAQDPQNSYNLHIRTSDKDIGQLVAAVKREVQALDADQPIGKVTTMDEAVAASLATRRLLMALLAAFALLALTLASVGLYGVMALTVTQRTRELGIRLALGAARANIFKLVLSHGMTLIGIGVVAGVIGALAVGRLLVSLLYNVQPVDLGAALCAVISLSIVALIACCVPARRATRVDPIVALREE